MPSPRFGWLQLLAGHDYFSRPEHPAPPADEAAELAQWWSWYTQDAAATDAVLPAALALVPEDEGLTVLTADHGELFPDRGAFMLGAPDSRGHGIANSPMELHVPLGLRGPGVAGGRRSDPVSTLDLHDTLLAAAGLPASSDLRTAAHPHLPGASLCNLMNMQVTEGAGNMSVLVRPDGSQLVRTHSPDAVAEGERPPLLARWPARGVGYRPDWQALTTANLSDEEAVFLFEDALPRCKGFRDLCDE
jgi:hypothetical protein